MDSVIDRSKPFGGTFPRLDYTGPWSDDDSRFYRGSRNPVWTEEDRYLIRSPVTQWDRPIFPVEVDEETLQDRSGKSCGHRGYTKKVVPTLTVGSRKEMTMTETVESVRKRRLIRRRREDYRATNSYQDLPHTISIPIRIAAYIASVCTDVKTCILANALTASDYEDPVLGKLVALDARGGVWKTFVSLFFEKNGEVTEYRGRLSSKAVEQVRAFDDLQHHPRELKSLQRSWLDTAKSHPDGLDYITDYLVINPPPPSAKKGYRANASVRGRTGTSPRTRPVVRLRTIAAGDSEDMRRARAKARRALANAKRAVDKHQATAAS